MIEDVPDNSMQDLPFPASTLGLSLEGRIAKAIELYGETEVVARSISLLNGRHEAEEFLLLVGGEHAQGILNGAPVLYWPELWGLRALLHVWSDDAISPVLESLKNPAWRVREMGCRVIALRGLPAAHELASLTTDSTARVRAAAARTLGSVGSPEDLEHIRTLTKDPVLEVRRSAKQGIDTLRSRFPSTR